MKNIEKAILEFDGKRSSIFLNHVNNHDNLNEKEKELVNKIWNEASQFELWNHTDLNVGVKNSIQYVIAHYSMDMKACKKMVNAISYEWL
ncbi:hypothetical protein ACU8V7_16085 [Zobellia nedashkovskayae]